MALLKKKQRDEEVPEKKQKKFHGFPSVSRGRRKKLRKQLIHSDAGQNFFTSDTRVFGQNLFKISNKILCRFFEFKHRFPF